MIRASGTPDSDHGQGAPAFPGRRVTPGSRHHSGKSNLAVATALGPARLMMDLPRS